jgi:hypothetical protein
MGRTLLFARQRPRQRLPKKSTTLTQSPAARELLGKVEILDRVRPGAVEALNVVAGQFIVKVHRQAKADLLRARRADIAAAGEGTRLRAWFEARLRIEQCS